MDWIERALNSLADCLPCGYAAGGPPAAEPTALAALALLGAGRHADARPALDWLRQRQIADGSLPPYADLSWPGWPTPLAIIATVVASRFGATAGRLSATAGLSSSALDLKQAQQWLLSAAGNRLEPSPAIGHDVTLIGWPWVLGTHSWQEPTAWSVLALKSLGLSQHVRTREAVRMLVDRLLPEGGCNYGNTWVLGQYLRPQVEPTGVVMMALADERLDDPRIARSLEFLVSELSAESTALSLSYGLLGLAAHDRLPSAADHWLEAAWRRTLDNNAPPFQLAALALASQGRDCPLMKFASVIEPQAQGLQPLDLPSLNLELN